jgi:drug/metabolite transporter (DMT)-like permease
MPLDALALLLGAAVLHATWNYIAKGARNDLAFIFGMYACSAVVYLPVAAIAFAVTDSRPGWDALAFVAVSSCFHLLYYVTLTQGYRVGDLSLVYPLARGTGPVLAVAGGILIYGERPSLVALLGAALIAAGILVISWPRNGRAGEGVAVSVAFALATGAVTATYTLWDKTGVDTTTPLLYGYGLQLFGFLYLVPLALSTADRRAAVLDTAREQPLALIAIAVLVTGAYILVLGALSLAPVSYVAPAREVSILFGALLGWRLLREPDPLRRGIGAAAIVVGVAALATG